MQGSFCAVTTWSWCTLFAIKAQKFATNKLQNKQLIETSFYIVSEAENFTSVGQPENIMLTFRFERVATSSPWSWKRFPFHYPCEPNADPWPHWPTLLHQKPVEPSSVILLSDNRKQPKQDFLCFELITYALWGSLVRCDVITSMTFLTDDDVTHDTEYDENVCRHTRVRRHHTDQHAPDCVMSWSPPQHIFYWRRFIVIKPSFCRVHSQLQTVSNFHW